MKNIENFFRSILILSSISLVFGEFERCKLFIPQDISICRKPHPPVTNRSLSCPFNETSICSKSFTFSHIKLEPFRSILADYLRLLFSACCGTCYRLAPNQTYNTSSEFTAALNERFKETSDFVYPILGKSTLKAQYGYHFLPAVDIKKAHLVTLKISSSDILKDLIISCLELWPLLAICLFLAFIAGFFIWIMDTWSNSVEFPRPFVRGVSEGFWWAFVSMTTVGYGDKTPKSVPARTFGVMWILVGISVCSMFTASLTNALTNASTLPSIDVSGKKIGILNDHFADAAFALQSGAVITYQGGLETIEEKLEAEEVDAFVINFVSTTLLRNSRHVDTGKFQFQQIEVSDVEFSYGLLIKNESDYEYFRYFVEENDSLYKACTKQLLNTISSEDSEAVNVFSGTSGIFLRSLAITCAMIAAILIFGCFYEKIRLKRKHKQSEDVSMGSTKKNGLT